MAAGRADGRAGGRAGGQTGGRVITQVEAITSPPYKVVMLLPPPEQRLGAGLSLFKSTFYIHIYVYMLYIYMFIQAYIRSIYDAFSFLSEKASHGAWYTILEAEIQTVC